MKTAKWRNLNNFPQSNGTWEVLVSPVNWSFSGEQRVKRAIKNAVLLNPVLISTPQTNGRFVPPIAVDQEKVGTKLANDSVTIFRMTLVFWIAGVVLSAISGQILFAAIWGLVFGSLTLLAHQMRKTAVDTELLTERWQFFGWCSSIGSAAAAAFLTFMVIAGGIQISGSYTAGGHHELLDKFGLLYQPIGDQENLRVLTAPLLHVNAAHWIINTVLGSALVSVIGAICNPRFVIIVVSSTAVFGLATTSLLSPVVDWGADGIVGISGGVSGLFGLLLVMVYRFPNLFPQKMLYSIVLTTIVLLLASPVFINLGGFAAHTAGLILGGLLGYVHNPIAEKFIEEEQVAERPGDPDPK